MKDPTRRDRGRLLRPLALVVSTLLSVSCGEDTAMTVGGEADGASAYLRRCGGCHGAAGTEQAATSLAGVRTGSESDVRTKIVNGSSTMPAFGGQVDPAEIDAIVEYVMVNFS